MSTLLQRLLDEYEVFHYATRVASALDSTDVPDPVSYSMTESDWRGFIPFLEEAGFDYTTESLAALEDLREIVRMEQYDGVAGEAMQQLDRALEPNLDRDLGLFEDEVRQTLEEEVVLRFHYAAGMVERSLTRDPTVSRALDVFGAEMAEVIGWSGTTGAAEDPTRE